MVQLGLTLQSPYDASGDRRLRQTPSLPLLGNRTGSNPPYQPKRAAQANPVFISRPAAAPDSTIALLGPGFDRSMLVSQRRADGPPSRPHTASAVCKAAVSSCTLNPRSVQVVGLVLGVGVVVG